MEGAADAAEIAAELNARRRTRRRAAQPLGDRLTDIYALIVAVIVFVPGVGSIFQGHPNASLISTIHERGAALFGVPIALAVAAALRSGARGGPLVLQPADVNVLLLAPVDQREVLVPRLRRLVAIGVAGAGAAGLVAGLILSTRLRGPAVEWTFLTAVATAAGAALALGAALVANALDLSLVAVNVIAVALLAWVSFDVTEAHTTSPASLIGSVAAIPEAHGVATGVAGLLLAAVVTAVGLLMPTRVGPEAALRRAAATSALTNAIALQDVRGVLRASHAEPEQAIRRLPWGRPPPPRIWPSWRRAWRGILRFPVGRIGRIVLTATAVALAMRASWALPAAAVVAIVLAYLAGLEVIEPIGQEVDRPTRRSGYPVSTVTLYARLQAPSVILLSVALLVGAGVTGIVAGFDAFAVVAILAVPTALAAVAGATYVIARGRPDLSSFLLDPMGTRVYTYHLIPAALAGSGAATALLVHRLMDQGIPAQVAATRVSSIPLFAAAIAWTATAWSTRGDATT